MAQLQTTAVTGSLTVTGNITAQSLVVQTITSSISYITGSTIFGSSLSNTHQITGSFYQTGSLAVFAGNVGIGTTSPGVRLQVHGTNDYGAIFSSDSGRAGWIINKPGTSTAKASGLVLSSDESFRLGTLSYYHIVLDQAGSTSIYSTAGSAATTFTAGGSVGIGTTSPGSLLTVSKAYATYTPGEYIFQVRSGLSTANPIFGIEYSSDAAIVSIGYVGIGTAVSRIYLNGGTSNGPSSITFYNQSTLGTFISSNNSYFNNGNLGVGTNSPSRKLDVAGDISWGVSGGTYMYAGGTTHRFAYSDSNTNYLYSGGTNGLRINNQADTVTLAIITNDGNLGIGTTVPSYKLHTAGNAYISDTLIIDGGGNTLTLRKGSGTAAMAFGGTSDQASFLIEGVAGGGMQLYTSAGGTLGTPGWASRMYVSSSGNVGIGTTAPSSILQLGAGSYTATNTSYNSFHAGAFGVLFRNAYDSYLAFNTVYTAGGWVNKYSSYKSGIINMNDGVLDISTGDGTTAGGGSNLSTKLVMLNNGCVGIGTTTPDNQLHVHKSSAGSVIANVNSPLVVENSGNTYISALAPDANESGILFGRPTSNVDGGIIYNSALARGLEFRTAGNAYRMGIDANGNVGIGTTSPTSILHVQGTDQFIRVSNSSTGNGGIKISYLNNEAHGLHLIYNPNSAVSYIDNTYQAVSGQVYGDIYFRQNVGGTMTSRMMIKADGGNIGIGTTVPAAKLDIVGAASGLALSFGATVPNNPLFLNTYGGWSGIGMDSATAGLRLAGDYSSGTVSLVDIGYYTSATVSHANWVSRLKVINNGNVGIGSTSPAYKLDINGVTRFQDIVRFKTESWNLSDDSVSRLYFGANARTYFGSANGYEWRNAADGTIVTLINSGNLGIGTTAPATKLQVVGTFASTALWTDASSIVYWGNYSTGYGRLTWDAGYAAILANSGNKLYLGANTTHLAIDTTGNVGINTTSPASRLQVSGSSNVLNIKGSGSLSNTSLLSVDGAYGRLFEVTDDLSNSLFSVNTIAGLPVIEAFADYSVNLGTYSAVSGSTMRITGSSVGIGTTAPGYKLHVSTDETYSTIANFTHTFNNRNLKILGDPSGMAIGDGDNFVGQSIYFNKVDNSIQIGTNSTTKAVITSAGNVGIGTTAPTQKLHIYGSNPRNYIQDSGTGYPILQLVNNSGDFYIAIDSSVGSGFGSAYGRYIYSAGAYPLIVATNSAERMRITSDGNVGIGTTVPYQLLHINGNILLDGLANGYTQSATRGIGYGSNSGAVGVDGFSGMDIQSVNAPAPYNSNYSQNLRFFTHHYGAGTGGTPRMFIQYNGNVGIGTTSPVAKLSVAGVVKVSGGSFPSAGDGLELNFTGTTGYVGAFNRDSAVYRSLYFYSSEVFFEIGASIRAVINSSGNLGIGATVPNRPLHIARTAAIAPVINLNTTDSTSNGAIIWTNSAGTQNVAIGTNYNVSDTGALEFISGTTTNMVLRSNGDVGIGTTNPAGQLSGTRGLSIVNAANAALGLSNGTNHWLNYLSSTTYRIWNNSSNEVVTILLNGNVGIATTAAARRLDVAGDIAWGTAAGTYMYAGGTSHRYAWSNSTENIIYSGGTGGLGINNAADSVRLVQITDAGNVGIGTTSPTRTLDVRGSANIQSSGSLLLLVTGSQGELLKVQDSGSSLGTLAVISSTTTNVATFTTSSVIISGSLLVNGSTSGIAEHMILAVSDETTNITTGTAKVTFRAPFAMTLTQIPRASLSTASTSGLVTVDINESGTSILGANKLSIDANELTSTTAATPTTLADTSIADDAQITIDIDGAGTGARGLKVTLYYVKV